MDYISGPYSITFPVNVTRVEFNIEIINDNLYEGNEDFMLAFDQSSLPTGFFLGNITQSTVTIVQVDRKL